MSLKMKLLRFSGTLTYKWIAQIKTRLSLINKKKRICYLVDFALSADYRVKVKEGKKLDKYPDLTRKLK